MSGKHFWENISDDFDEKFDRYTDYFGFDCVIDLLGDIKNKKVLDYGCGEAQLSSRLAQKGAFVTGTDISIKALESARKKYKKLVNLEFLELDAPVLFKKKHYEVCVSSFVFTCIGDLHEIEKIFSDIYLSLTDHGKFYILLPNPEAIGKQFYSFKCDPVESLSDGSKVEYTLRGMKEKFPDFWWSDDFFVTLLNKVGFSKVKIHKLVPSKDEKWIEEQNCPPFVIYESEK